MPPEPAAASHLQTWARLAPLGLTVVGLGASLLGEATLRKGRGEAWVLYGTAALAVLNAGLCLFGEAVKHRALAESGHGQRARPTGSGQRPSETGGRGVQPSEWRSPSGNL